MEAPLATTSDITKRLLNQLDQLEALLRKFKYWQTQSPDLSIVTNPFGVNQISLFEWLQFIYLPLMRDIAVLGQGIPSSEIYPYAEQVISDATGASEILTCIQQLDSLTHGGSADD